MPETPETNEQESTSDSKPRAIWSGTISFGLVSIPVTLLPANRDSRVSLRKLNQDGQPLEREYQDSPDTIRGYEAGNGTFVTASDEELEEIQPEKSRDIDLQVFVARDEISPVYFHTAYYLAPAENSDKAYRLLTHTMQRTNRAGIATFVMRGREYLVAILAERGILRAQRLRFSDEIRKPADLGLREKKEPEKALVKTFEAAIAKAQRKTVDVREMRDEYADAMLGLIEKKRAALQQPAKSPARRQRPVKVVDVVETLKQTLPRTRKSSSNPKK